MSSRVLYILVLTLHLQFVIINLDIIFSVLFATSLYNEYVYISDKIYMNS